ncbi:MAG TPA: amidohydrolase family protein [Myxococcota bacterium]|nr:amidohydrolase family protein [Myxococcota bacterium]
MSLLGIGSRATKAAALRERLGHPVVDADGHYIETGPALKEFVREYARDAGGGDLAERFERVGGIDYDETVLRPWSRLSDAERRATWATRPPWWSLPAANSLDRATAHLPGLLAERLGDLGIDFAVLYPSRTLTTTAIRDAEVRQVACRALNAFAAEVYRPYADRLTPVAQVPTHTPAEAIAGLEHAVLELGLKAVMINGLVHRPIGGAAAGPGAQPQDPRLPNWGSGSGERLDGLGLDSEHDYDPFWRRCVELRVALASHAPGMGWGSRRSISSYMHNHVGSFAASMDATCKSLFFGGVTRRFPGLSFGLLEGGVGWAVQLVHDLVGHFEKRNVRALQHLNPSRIDVELVLKLFEAYGGGRLRADLAGLRDSFTRLEPAPPELDEWKALGATSEDELLELFVPRFYFGCEADDPTVAWAFAGRLLPGGRPLRAMFSSDLGHWDVPDMGEILLEAHELVEDGHLSEADFREFVFGNPVRFYTSGKRDFFRGTGVEAQAEALLAEDAGR